MGNRIRELRRKYPMSQQQLAKHLHISQAAVSGYETGTYEPDLELTKKMADIFGVSIDYLLGHDTQEIQPQEWSADYPNGVALRRDMTGYKSVPRSAPQGLTDEDLLKIAEYVRSHHPELGESHTIEAKILSEGVDRMPKEARERAVEVMKLVFAEYASYFERNDDDEA